MKFLRSCVRVIFVIFAQIRALGLTDRGSNGGQGTDISDRLQAIESLDLMYKYHIGGTSYNDVKANLPTLRSLSSECNVVMEMGVRNMVGTVAILLGLSENKVLFPNRTYIGVDPLFPDHNTMTKISRLASETNTLFVFLAQNDMNMKNFLTFLPDFDLLFINSLHTYCHVYYSLEYFASKSKKYIVINDTNGPWAFSDQDNYNGTYVEYPSEYDCKNNKGVMNALKKFLLESDDWRVVSHAYPSQGFTVLVRKNFPKYSDSNSS